MRNHRLIFVCALVSLLLGAGCQFQLASRPPAANPAAAPPAAVPAANAVLIKNFSFEPLTLTVKSGTTVTWTNEEVIVHSVIYDDYLNPEAVKFVSGQLSQGQSFSFTFSKPGEYGYHCGIHNSMKGKIVVTPQD